jgi:RHS repeat-associated protein
MHSQFTLNANNQGADLAFFQEFKSEQDPNGTEYWYHYDGEGNIAATTKHKAQSDHTYRYDEYGLILPDNGTSLGQVGSDNTQGSSGWDFPHNQYTLTQKYADPHTNLLYFGSRHYDPEVGTWLTQDSYRGAVPNPQSLHRYMYNYANSINYQDTYGFCSNQSNIDEGCASWMSDSFYSRQKLAFTIAQPLVQYAASYGIEYGLGFGYQVGNNSTFGIPYMADWSVNRLKGNNEALVDRAGSVALQEGRRDGNIASVAQGATEIAGGVSGISVSGGTLATCPASGGISCPVSVPASVVISAASAVSIVHGTSVTVCAGLSADQINKNIENKKPTQNHHYGTNKSKQFTPRFEEITKKYNLDLDDGWNTELLPHQGRHPNEYHDWMLSKFREADRYAQGDTVKFKQYLDDNAFSYVRENPNMLYKEYWINNQTP